MTFRYLSLLTTFFIFATICWSSIRRVPDDYPTISSAISNCDRGDTIILGLGTYTEPITLSSSITIASLYLLSHDSTAIHQTNWQASNNRVITAQNCTLRVAGLKFTPIIPSYNSGVMIATNSYVAFDNCRIENVFDSIQGVPRGLIYTSDVDSKLSIDKTVFQHDNIGNVHSIYARGKLTVTRSSFFNREQSRDADFAIFARDSLFIENCLFDHRGPGLSIGNNFVVSNSVFRRLGCYAIEPASARMTYGLFTNCQFDSLIADDSYQIISLSANQALVEFRDCEFNGTNENTGGFAMFRCASPVFFKRCKIQSISGVSVLIRGNNVHVDSCIFSNNLSPLFSKNSAEANVLSITNTDYYNNSTFDTTPMGSSRIDTANAINCYWGHASGPHHVLNPDGAGMNLNNYVNPFPFRTTPVFPENGIGEPGNVTYSLPNSIELLPAYPNPFNSSVTIRFRLPQPGDATVAIYDLTGREVATLYRGNLPVATPQRILWQPQQLASGTFFVQLQSGSEVSVKRINYLR
ncbi:MAG: T9SS type A sorting domain-containing protein [bacterium]|nr:T9SS type A sorting domain-containing protein [bacterium]